MSESELDQARMRYLERALDHQADLLRKALDENAVLLKRALAAELRIADHMQSKTTPDMHDFRLWGIQPE